MTTEKIALVTGANKGIGLEIVQQLAKAGFRVLLTARDRQRGEEASRKLQQDGLRVEFLQLDVTDETSIDRLAKELVSQIDHLDVLVNNAGIGGAQKHVQELTTAEWDYVIDVNLKGAFLCSREVLKRMTHDTKSNTARNAYSIINISSVHESIPQPQSAPYSASKGGMEMLTKTVALEVAGRGVRVNGIAPGAIATDMNKDILEDEQKKKDEEMRIPMHRIGDPEEIAKVALFLASDDASYMTGTTVYVDGGLTLSS